MTPSNAFRCKCYMPTKVTKCTDLKEFEYYKVFWNNDIGKRVKKVEEIWLAKRGWKDTCFCLHIFEELSSDREEISIGAFIITSENKRSESSRKRILIQLRRYILIIRYTWNLIILFIHTYIYIYIERFLYVAFDRNSYIYKFIKVYRP